MHVHSQYVGPAAYTPISVDIRIFLQYTLLNENSSNVDAGTARVLASQAEAIVRTRKITHSEIEIPCVIVIYLYILFSFILYIIVYFVVATMYHGE